jgi:N-acetylglucosaminyldiphosphoundecaprenol N-acetyl-beta-D-mannosaminyltransferase
MEDKLPNRDRAEVLGCYIDLVDMEQALSRIEAFINHKHTAEVMTLNSEIIYRARQDHALKTIINRTALVTPDGIGVLWAGKKLGTQFPERVTGIDLLQALCRQAAAKEWRIFFLGAAPEVAQQAADRLRQEFTGLNICGVQDGYFGLHEEADIIEEINRTQPDIIAVGFGAPKQEFWIDRHRHQLQAPVMIGVGGSLDVLAGVKKRAPQWVINLNLEWLYRLVREPSRWKRQLSLPLFVWAVLQHKYFPKPF